VEFWERCGHDPIFKPLSNHYLNAAYPHQVRIRVHPINSPTLVYPLQIQTLFIMVSKIFTQWHKVRRSHSILRRRIPRTMSSESFIMHCGTFFALSIVASTFSYALWPSLCASTPSSTSLFNRAYVLLCDATLLVLRTVALCRSHGRTSFMRLRRVFLSSKSETITGC
jgi:hypothetical protein